MRDIDIADADATFSTTPLDLQRMSTHRNVSRIIRALYENMSVTLVGSSYYERYFDVIGSRGIKYHVRISKEPTCTCPDFIERKGRCKHQILCLIRECGCTTTDVNLHDSRYIDIENILNDSDQLQPKLDCECPICFETLFDVETNIQCEHCKKIYHKRCMHEWLKTKNTCPTCRSAFHLYPFRRLPH